MVIAFIPVRGGSKSIPLKNIKCICGKPLVCWSIDALEDTDEVDEIVVSTDSDEIESVVLSRGYKKTKVFRRSEKTSTDSASTESAMLEYIDSASLDPDDIFMLVQATSPMTRSDDFSKAINYYKDSAKTSLVTCTRTRRFFWNKDGQPLNYDYKKRPRRQDFDGTYMENGAFYMSRVWAIKTSKCRLSGDIAVYELPEWMSCEIDEPSDWETIEKEMYRRGYVPKKDIKLIAMDVDGTLTDGGMYYSENGDELKKFSTRDGMGIKLAIEAGIEVAIVTGEDTKIVERRANKLGVKHVFQGKSAEDKARAIESLCKEKGILMEEVAYIGDDVNCIPLLKSVGIAGCPGDAMREVRELNGIYVMEHDGGEGCVREFINLIIL